jgi:hypothetical protein
MAQDEKPAGTPTSDGPKPAAPISPTPLPTLPPSPFDIVKDTPIGGGAGAFTIVKLPKF